MVEKRGSLTIFGTGIAAIGQITLEAQGYIAKAEKLLYLVADPLTTRWILENNSEAEDLYSFYAPDRDRLTTYYMMTERILGYVRSGLNVCVAFYGHPAVFVFPSHEAILRARHEGYEARMLAAVSAEDCLFADLGIDPGRAGCQSFEATDFLVHRRLFDPSCGLVLWQVGIVGQIYNATTSSEKVSVLIEVLGRTYGLAHNVIVYEANHYPVCDPKIQKVVLQDLASTELSAISTLYVPPVKLPVVDIEMASRLGIPEEFLRMRGHTQSLYDPLKPRVCREQIGQG